MHSVKGVQACSNEGPCSFSRGENDEIAKTHVKGAKVLQIMVTGTVFLIGERCSPRASFKQIKMLVLR